MRPIIAFKTLGVMLSALFILTVQAQTDRCYRYNTAYVTGKMNIRENPSVSAKKVGTAEAGESYEVSDSRQGQTYCWLKIKEGWMAVTGRVRSVEPAATPEPDDRTFPKIVRGIYHGEARSVTHALEYLERKSDYWYNYVVDVIKEIHVEQYVEIDGKEFALSVSHPDNIVKISYKFLRQEQSDIIAAALVHEACHVYQNERHGPRSRIQVFSDTVKDERECYGVESRALLVISPRQREYSRKLACLSREYNPYFSNDYIIKFVCGIGLGKL